MAGLMESMTRGEAVRIQWFIRYALYEDSLKSLRETSRMMIESHECSPPNGERRTGNLSLLSNCSSRKINSSLHWSSRVFLSVSTLRMDLPAPSLSIFQTAEILWLQSLPAIWLPGLRG